MSTGRMWDNVAAAFGIPLPASGEDFDRAEWSWGWLSAWTLGGSITCRLSTGEPAVAADLTNSFEGGQEIVCQGQVIAYEAVEQFIREWQQTRGAELGYQVMDFGCGDMAEDDSGYYGNRTCRLFTAASHTGEVPERDGSGYSRRNVDQLGNRYRAALNGVYDNRTWETASSGDDDQVSTSPFGNWQQEMATAQRYEPQFIWHSVSCACEACIEADFQAFSPEEGYGNVRIKVVFLDQAA